LAINRRDLTLAGLVALVLEQSWDIDSGHLRRKEIASIDKVVFEFHIDIDFRSNEFRVVAGDNAQKLLDFLARRKPLIKVLVQGVETIRHDLRTGLKRWTPFILVEESSEPRLGHCGPFTEFSLPIVVIHPSLVRCSAVLGKVIRLDPGPGRSVN
jgi:hypothetical protein